MVPFLIALVVFCVVAYILYLIVSFIVGHFAVGLYDSGMSLFRFRR